MLVSRCMSERSSAISYNCGAVIDACTVSAFIQLAGDDDAIHRRKNFGEAQVQIRIGQLALRLHDLRCGGDLLGERHFALCLGGFERTLSRRQLGLGRFEAQLRLFVSFARGVDRVFRRHIAQAFLLIVFALGLLHLRLRAGHSDLLIRDGGFGVAHVYVGTAFGDIGLQALRLRTAQGSLTLLEYVLEGGRIDFGESVALPYYGVEIGVHLHDVARNTATDGN